MWWWWRRSSVQAVLPAILTPSLMLDFDRSSRFWWCVDGKINTRIVGATSIAFHQLRKLQQYISVLQQKHQ